MHTWKTALDSRCCQYSEDPFPLLWIGARCFPLSWGGDVIGPDSTSAGKLLGIFKSKFAEFAPSKGAIGPTDWMDLRSLLAD